MRPRALPQQIELVLPEVSLQNGQKPIVPLPGRIDRSPDRTAPCPPRSTSRSVIANLGCREQTARPRALQPHRPCQDTPGPSSARSLRAGPRPQRNVQDGSACRKSAASVVSAAKSTCPSAATHAYRPAGRTSRPAPPANDLHPSRSGYSAILCRPTCWSPHGRRPRDNHRCDWVQQFSKFGSRAFSSIVLQHRAPTSGLGSRTPMAAWCESISGKFIDKGVDMTRRLNNAGALPTCPQP
jgi:hypothetical protein